MTIDLVRKYIKKTINVVLSDDKLTDVERSLYFRITNHAENIQGIIFALDFLNSHDHVEFVDLIKGDVIELKIILSINSISEELTTLHIRKALYRRLYKEMRCSIFEVDQLAVYMSVL